MLLIDFPCFVDPFVSIFRSLQATVIVFTLTSIGGHEAWKFELPGGISAGIMFEMLFYVSAIVSNLPVVLWNIYK